MAVALALARRAGAAFTASARGKQGEAAARQVDADVVQNAHSVNLLTGAGADVMDRVIEGLRGTT
jgi:hypothetical protein